MPMLALLFFHFHVCLVVCFHIAFLLKGKRLLASWFTMSYDLPIPAARRRRESRGGAGPAHAEGRRAVLEQLSETPGGDPLGEAAGGRWRWRPRRGEGGGRRWSGGRWGRRWSLLPREQRQGEASVSVDSDRTLGVSFWRAFFSL